MSKRTLLFCFATFAVFFKNTNHLHCQETLLFNYLSQSIENLSGSEQDIFYRLWESNHYLEYRFAELNNPEDAFVGTTVSVNLPDRIAVFRVDWVQQKLNGDFYWMGFSDTPSEGGSFTLSYESLGGYMGHIAFNSQESFYHIFPLSQNKVVLLKTIKDFLPCGTKLQLPELGEEDDVLEIDPRNLCPTSNIRILFLFTNRANSSGLSPVTVANRIIDELNTTTQASQLQPWEIRFELANVINLGLFVETDNISSDVEDLVADEIAQNLRASNFADIVILLTNSPLYDAAGIVSKINADFDHAFSIAQIFPASVGFTASHEVGHMLGARHQRCSICGEGFLNLTGGCDIWTLGHGFTIGDNFRTIMYQNGCDMRTRLGRWSNPDAELDGEETGNYWNRSSKPLRRNAPKIACFFDSPETPNTNMIAGISGPSSISCIGTWYASITNNLGTPPNNYSWEISDNGISNWVLVNSGSNFITASQIESNWSYDYECGESFFLRLRVSDSSSPTLLATNSKQINVICCVDGEVIENRNFSLEYKVNALSALFPIPSSGTLFYKALPFYMLEILNLEGKVLHSFKKNTAEIADFVIDLTNLPAGVYLAKQTKQKNIILSKIIKL
ncbi:MAG TPA: zinc-dependent metalloprotease [Saprospiraceae bacterium]|nr:zinc-dependent metalloprotease [Saprospiraceae bacterium]HMQ84206.1 zinc-dependent metalloprotease [Saprospiraceae bacterium]